MALLLLLYRRYCRALGHHIEQRQQHTDGKFCPFTEIEAHRIRLQHPQRDLEGLAIGMLYGCSTGGPAWPSDDVKTAVMKWVKGIEHRHGRRHGIQCGCF
jgi:hypothetical protein